MTASPLRGLCASGLATASVLLWISAAHAQPDPTLAPRVARPDAGVIRDAAVAVRRPDGGAPPARALDAGAPLDGGSVGDGGPPLDAEARALDAGAITDAASLDGGVPSDGGAEADGGVPGAQAEEEPSESPDTGRSSVAIRTLLALLGMLALAYVAGHPRARKLEERLGISQGVAAGFPFFALGAIAHLPQVGLLSDSLLQNLTPLLEFGLGWIGLLAGLSFDVRAADKWPRGTENLVAVLTFVPFLVIAGVTGALLYALSIPIDDSRLMRDAAAFGAAGCLAAPTASTLLSATLSERAAHVVRTVAVVDDLVGVLLLILLSALYRPTDGNITWELPGVGWIFVTLGLGICLGILTYAILRVARDQREVTALLLGSIAFAAGSATFFSVSPIVICFVTGLVVANLPGRHHENMRAPLARLERPIYLMFLLVAGAIWRFDAWQGYALLLAFVVARLAGRVVAAQIASRRGMLHQTPGEERAVARAFTLAPVGALSIAIVVNLQALYPGRTVPLMITAVVGGALVSEVTLQLASRWWGSRAPSPAPAPPIAEEPPS